MAFEQHSVNEWKSIPATRSDSEITSACFDCNICLDFAHDPVVTLCGHLYCWPCLYKWINLQSSSPDSNEHPQCPVCKAEISQTSVVPLYGRGQSHPEAEPDGKAPALKLVVPPRPPASATQYLSNTAYAAQQLPRSNAYQNLQNFPNQYTSYVANHTTPLNIGSTTITGVFHPVIGMFGEMVYARVFGSPASLYAYPSSYHLEGSISPRLRRQEIQADKALNRITVFLFCCFLLCLMLF